ncbi:MAG TPA: ABC transporter ATP-binding protein [Patescibacteria group bacterium]|nr:ABC transporter ATP-binding protein [Patescibacteria group bacterium]
MSLLFQSISKNFPTVGGNPVTAIKAIDLSVVKSEFTVLLGPSGCGKSTLLHLAAGLDVPCTGQILFNGQPCHMPGPDRAIVFQEAALFPWLTVLENIMFAILGVSKTVKRSRACEYLEKVHLTNFANAYPHQLSGGMKQRVSIARALATESEVLLMDEPFAALDEQTRLELHEELLRIWEDTGKTILFVTHNIRESLRLADRIILLSARPAQIIREIRLDLPRPRPVASIHYVELEEEILTHLKREIFKGGHDHPYTYAVSETPVDPAPADNDLGLRL